MNTLDMNEIKSRTYRDAFFRDGLTEMSYGVLFLCLAYLFDYINQFGFGLRLVISPLVTGMAVLPVLIIIGFRAKAKHSRHHLISMKEIALAVLFLLFTVLPLAFFLVLVMVLILSGRNKITYSRIGYVAVKNEIKPGVFCIYAVITLSPIILLLVTNLLHVTGSRPLIYRLSPLLFGLSLFSVAWFSGERTHISAYRYSAIGLWFASMGLAASPLAETEMATVLYCLASGVFMLGVGLLRLIRFIRDIPILEEASQEDACQPLS